MGHGRYMRLYNLCSSLKKIGPKHLHSFLPNLSDSSMENVYEVISNVLRNKNVSMKKRRTLKRKVRRYKKHLRYVVRKKNSRTRKRKLMKSVGGAALTTILAIALPLLLTALKKRKNK